jgi:putative chitinase
MSELTLDVLKACLPQAKSERLSMFLEGLNETFEHFEINTPARQAMFIAQTAHESGNFSAVEENLNYAAKALMAFWPKKFAGVADAYARNPQKIANRAYCDRMGNGPESSGEGFKYRGRGLIQLTGKDNYKMCGRALGIDLLEDPDQVAKNPVAVLSAGWFWDTRKLNTWADKEDVTTVTKKINGGVIGLADRTAHFHHILEVLKSVYVEEIHLDS